MRIKEIKEAFDRLNPKDELKNEIYETIIRGSERRESKSKWRITHMAAAVAASIAVICISTIGINAATGGAVVSRVRQMFGLSGETEETAEVIYQTQEDITRAMIYAPEIVYLDDKTLMFAVDRGIILYDREKCKVSFSIDLQKTDCIYWGADAGEIHTHAFFDETKLWVFNEKAGSRVGRFYSYDVKEELHAAEYADDALWKKLYKKWLEIDESYQDTFAEFISTGTGLDKQDGEIMYSERSFAWKSEAGTAYLSFMTVPTDEKGVPSEKRFVLNSYDTETDKMYTENLEVFTDTGSEEPAKKIRLPEFEYTGDDLVVAAIVKAELIDLDDYGHSANDVWIPGYIIYDRVEKDGSLYVFGNFWGFSYYLNGNTLMCESGGERPARIELQKQDDGNYSVVDTIVTGDGADYETGIREFCKGFSGIYEKFFSDWDIHEQNREKRRKEFIRMYEEKNHLGIEYYKDFGWEPVAIKE